MNDCIYKCKQLGNKCEVLKVNNCKNPDACFMYKPYPPIEEIPEYIKKRAYKGGIVDENKDV